MAIDYVVSDKIKDLWSVLLDLLEQFKNGCKKYGFKYYAAGGTLLGAARHKGFIPWDDDLDVQMMWDDFQKLMEIADKEFKYPYFLQSYKNDEFGELSNNRLRRSDTTGFTKWEYDNIKNTNHNRGIFIDIFPLFPIPKKEADKKKKKDHLTKLWKVIRGWNAIQNNNSDYPSVYEQYIVDYKEYSKKYTIEQIKNQYMDLCAEIDGEFDEIGETSFRTLNDKFIWNKSWFEKSIELPFQNTTIACPAQYNEVLTKQFGDWKTPVFNGSNHEMYIFDTKVPYTQKKDLF